MRLVYNSPVILTYFILSVAILSLNSIVGGWIIPTFFTAGPINPLLPTSILGILLHILGHANWQHLTGNFILILLVGPLLEEKYGSLKMVLMIASTAFVTGVLNAIFFSSGIVGASGIAFMMLILASFANSRSGEIPVTFIFAVAVYIGNELLNSLADDNISQFGHILGGILGGVFGIWFAPSRRSTKSRT